MDGNGSCSSIRNVFHHGTGAAAGLGLRLRALPGHHTLHPRIAAHRRHLHHHLSHHRTARIAGPSIIPVRGKFTKLKSGRARSAYAREPALSGAEGAQSSFVVVQQAENVIIGKPFPAL